MVIKVYNTGKINKYMPRFETSETSQIDQAAVNPAKTGKGYFGSYGSDQSLGSRSQHFGLTGRGPRFSLNEQQQVELARMGPDTPTKGDHGLVIFQRLREMEPTVPDEETPRKGHLQETILLMNRCQNVGEMLVLGNESYLRTVAGNYSSLSFEDRVATAFLGAQQAVTQIDPEKGVPASYLGKVARNEITDAERRNTPLHVPTRALRAVPRVEAAFQEYIGSPEFEEYVRAQNGKVDWNKIVTDIAERAGESAEEGMEIIENDLLSATSLQANVRTEEGRDELISIIPDPSALSPEEIVLEKESQQEVEHKQLQQQRKHEEAEGRSRFWQRVERQLSPRQREVISLSFGLGNSEEGTLSNQEIAERLGVHPSRVSQIRKKALEKLSETTTPQELKAALV